MTVPRRRFPKIEELPPFDPEAVCPKCGHTHVDARYRTDVAFSGQTVEWISRQCKRCGYLWSEACLSSSADNPVMIEDEDDDDWRDEDATA